MFLLSIFEYIVAHTIEIGISQQPCFFLSLLNSIAEVNPAILCLCKHLLLLNFAGCKSCGFATNTRIYYDASNSGVCNL
jgi:hypothetical protein